MNVQWISQTGNAEANDCGPAAALMVARSVGKGMDTDVSALSREAPMLREFDPNQDGTTHTDVAKMLKKMGCTPADAAGSVYPHAALIAYRNLPDRYDQKYAGLHWIVRLSDTTYHDPLWPDAARGANKVTTKAILDMATRRVGVLDQPVLAGQSGTVASDAAYLNVRRNPSTSAPIICRLQNGARVDIAGTAADSQGRPWYSVSVPAAGAYRDQALTQPWPVELGWVAGWLVTVDGAPPPPVVDPPPVVTPPPVAATKPLVSLNVLGGGQRATEAMQAGAGGVFISFNPGHARELKRAYPKALIVARPFLEGVTTIDHWRNVVELDSLPAGTVVTSVNENQSYGDDTEKTLSDRAQWDEACLRECQQRGLTYAGGSFSFGCPPWTDAGVMRVLSVDYARLLKAGMWWNQHSYVGRDGSGQGGPGVPLAERFTRSYPVTMPDYRGQALTFNIRQSWWTCERVRFYCMLFGWDPRWTNFIFAECGLEGAVEMVDAPKPGGFNENSQVNFIQYMKDFQYWMGQPFEFGVDRKLYPSPVRGMFVFCANGGARWAGYEVGHRIPEMKAEFWR